MRTGIAVRGIREHRDGFRVDAGAAGAFTAKTVVLATQPHVAAQILDTVDADAAAAAGEIAAPPLAVVFLGFGKDRVDHALDGLGFLVPRDERRLLNGAQFCSTMFPARAPDGFVAVAGYFGGARAPDLGGRPAPELIDLARRELGDLIGAHGEPAVARVRHWPRGLPQYRLGHQRLVGRLRQAGERLPGLFLTGNYFRGPSVAECLSLATETADQVDAFLSTTRRNGTAALSSDRDVLYGNGAATMTSVIGR